MIRRHRIRRWMAPTAGLYGAIAFAGLGLIVFALGVGLAFRYPIVSGLGNLALGASAVLGLFVGQADIELAAWFIGLVLLIVGFLLVVKGVRSAISNVVETLNPGLKTGKVDVYVRRKQLAQGPHIVAMGGGTGLSTLLRGLKQHTSNITAVVTVTDDGGSSGRLIKDKGIIPPGDIRNCLVALADAEKAMTDIFQYRFHRTSGSLSGHSIGNLLIAGLVDLAGGDFDQAIAIASDVLNIRGRVVPSTMDRADLSATFDDGREVVGETAIVETQGTIRDLRLVAERIVPNPAAIEAIDEADVIVIGPGSVYTSVIPNLLVPGIADALARSQAIKVYICNVMTQPGESDHFSAFEHVLAIERTVGRRVFDYVMVNTGIPTDASAARYQLSGQEPVVADVDKLVRSGYKPVTGDYLNDNEVVRHDPMKIAAQVVSLVGR